MNRLQASFGQAEKAVESHLSHVRLALPLLLVARRFPLVVLPKALRGTSGAFDGLAAELGADGLAVHQPQAKVLTQKGPPSQKYAH